jgi:hypothetical protein
MIFAEDTLLHLIGEHSPAGNADSCPDKIAKVKIGWVLPCGDELYELKGVPGTWHEQCLTANPD